MGVDSISGGVGLASRVCSCEVKRQRMNRNKEKFTLDVSIPIVPDAILQAVQELALDYFGFGSIKGFCKDLDKAYQQPPAYGWDDYAPDMPDEEILARLFALNQEQGNS
jgi:hypothetical protein